MPLLYHNNNSISNVTSFAQVPSGSPVLLSTATASASSSIEFTSGIDSTYDVYYFEFINIHPQTDNIVFKFNLSTDGGSNYNVTKTTTAFNALHLESGSFSELVYDTGQDLAQSTADQSLCLSGADADQAISGSLFLYNPSSTTFVKHFTSTSSSVAQQDGEFNYFIAGYGNTTSAINAIKFVMSSGNIDAGTIKMYGIKA